MKTMKKLNNDGNLTGASLVRLAVEIASHPAFAGYTPTGQIPLATGQSGRFRRAFGPGPGKRKDTEQPARVAPQGQISAPDCHGCA